MIEPMLDPNYVGDDHLLKFWFLLAELSCLTPVAVQYERFFDVSIKNAESTQKGGKKGHFEAFLDPWLAWAPNDLGVK